jgi:hypothetical protein
MIVLGNSINGVTKTDIYKLVFRARTVGKTWEKNKGTRYGMIFRSTVDGCEILHQLVDGQNPLTV